MVQRTFLFTVSLIYPGSKRRSGVLSGASLEYGDGAQSRPGSVKPPHSKEAFVSIGYRDLKRFRAAPAIPSRPVPRSNMLVGSGTGLAVICP